MQAIIIRNNAMRKGYLHMFLSPRPGRSWPKSVFKWISVSGWRNNVLANPWICFGIISAICLFNLWVSVFFPDLYKSMKAWIWPLFKREPKIYQYLSVKYKFKFQLRIYRHILKYSRYSKQDFYHQQEEFYPKDFHSRRTFLPYFPI